MKNERDKKSVNNKSRSFGVLDLDPCLKISNVKVTSSSVSGGHSTSGGSSIIPYPNITYYGDISTLGIGTFPTYGSFPKTKITGLSTGPLTIKDSEVPVPCKDLPTYNTFIIDPNEPDDDACNDGSSPINPRCIGKKIDENGNCIDWAGMDDGLPNEWWNDDVFVENMFNKNPYYIWRNITQEERDLIKKHPYEAYAIYLNREIAEKATKEKFGGNYRNDKSDAFRHAFYSLINTKYVGITIATKFSDAHESETPTLLIKEKEMDLFNNNVGHNSISNNSNKTNIYLANLIYTKLLNGDLRYLSPINFSDPNFNTTQGISILTELIPTNN
ncbi:DUF6973 domain-containing protein [Tenacibaculum finnmarkense]|uniref:DUF6973 domain-containing protein n=1 Tax=Tenacibaculum finnmarkense TaxID=2781243 RepID=UPI001EFA2E28|nr:hypothetical protein [Tenacibaculum finnmarkense]MCG8787679.1 hypothetical protein [Tenacibaculum finnmarkense]